MITKLPTSGTGGLQQKPIAGIMGAILSPLRKLASMKIAVLNSSPKGPYSLTLQSARYMQKHFPSLEFEFFHIGQRIKALEKDPRAFQAVLAAVEQSDLVLWCYPVYTFLVPYQLVKFIDLVFERRAEGAFQGKYTAQLSTSKHFYDHTAYNYLHQLCEDLGMKHLPGHCADMDDLTTEQGRTLLCTFAAELQRSVESHEAVARKFLPTVWTPRPYTPASTQSDQGLPLHLAGESRVVLLTDNTDPHSNLGRMIEVYRQFLGDKLHTINIAEFPFQGGCLGCFHCAFEGKCAYQDGFDEFHRNNILSADCLIVAATIRRHWFNPVWKCYDDRQFYNGHRTSLMGKPIGYILSGPLRQEANLRQVLEARCEVGHMYLLDIVTDEYEGDEEITALLEGLARKTAWALEERPQRPVSFLGVGGLKIFRDLIYVMRGLMQEDHKFYKAHGFYDFPQQQVGKILQGQLLGLLLKSKQGRKKMSVQMRQEMLKRYEDIIARY